jgi:hypothetical protein
MLILRNPESESGYVVSKQNTDVYLTLVIHPLLFAIHSSTLLKTYFSFAKVTIIYAGVYGRWMCL